MSVRALACETCGVDGVVGGAGMFPKDSNEATYGVSWRCPKCEKLSLDLCPIGPVEPTPSSCLNCGVDADADTHEDACKGCGMRRVEAAEFLRVDGSKPTVDEAKAGFDAGLFRHGLAALNALLQADPANVEAWTEKGKTYQTLELNEAAIRCYRRATSLRPDPFLEIAIACAESDCGRHMKAIAIYDALIAKGDPLAEDQAPGDHPDALAIAYANRANTFELLAAVERAIADYEEAIRREPNRVTHYTNYARLFSVRKRWAEAREVVLRGLRVVTAEARIPLLLEKARTFNEEQEAEPGLDAADEVLAFTPNHPRALYQRAWALGMLGRLEEAHATLRELLEKEPQNADAQKALRKIESALPRDEPPKPWWKFWN